MADQWPQRFGNFERKARARRSLARGKRSGTPLRAAAEILSRPAEAEPRGCLVARESAGLDSSRPIRLDHGPRRFRATRAICERKPARLSALCRSAGNGTRRAALSEHG